MSTAGCPPTAHWRPHDITSLSGAVRERLDAVIHGEPLSRIPETGEGGRCIDAMQCGTLAVPARMRAAESPGPTRGACSIAIRRATTRWW